MKADQGFLTPFEQTNFYPGKAFVLARLGEALENVLRVPARELSCRLTIELSNAAASFGCQPVSKEHLA
jgi:hypothetical protein